MSRMLTVRISDELYDRLDKVAAAERVSRTDVVVDLLTRSIDARDARISALADRVLADRAELFERLA